MLDKIRDALEFEHDVAESLDCAECPSSGVDLKRKRCDGVEVPAVAREHGLLLAAEVTKERAAGDP